MQKVEVFVVQGKGEGVKRESQGACTAFGCISWPSFGVLNLEMSLQQCTSQRHTNRTRQKWAHVRG